MKNITEPMKITILRVPLLLPKAQLPEEYTKYLKFIAILNWKLWGSINKVADPSHWYQGLIKQAQDKTQIRWIAINEKKGILGYRSA